jgi:carbonic anhydrase
MHAMERRAVTKLLALAGLAAVAGSAPAFGDGPHWAYAGHEGPNHWGELSADFGVCRTGSEQSPIDLKSAVRSELGTVSVAWSPSPLTVVNNGHTIQVNTALGSRMVVDGESYELVQFHFHHQSEHTVDGRPYPMEVHFVHRSARGALAVLGVLLTEGAANPMLAEIWQAMPKAHGERRTAATIDPRTLLPARQDYFRYAGSLTTPPCAETVLWTVYAQPIEASRAQIEAFAALFPNNARPVQERHRRFLLSSF